VPGAARRSGRIGRSIVPHLILFAAFCLIGLLLTCALVL